jgi:uncharacterized protein YabE (DUF348 family)
VQRTAKLGLYGLVLAGLLGGTAAWATNGKSFELQIDGKQQTVHAAASDVRGVLAAAGVKVSDHDLVAPDLNSPVSDGAKVVVHRGHLLHLNVNGATKDVWVNADSVDEALGLLGYNDHSLVSVSRSTRLNAGATTVAISSPKKVTIKADGKSVSVLTAGPTVYQAIADAGVYLGPADKLSATGAISNNQVVTLKRVSYRASTEQVSVPFSTVTQKDGSQYVGTDSVVTQGRPGTNRVSYQLIFLDGKYAGRIVTSSVSVTRPVSQVNKVGSKPAPEFVSSVPAGSAQQIAAGMVAARGWGSDQFSCLVSLWNKESGWRTDAANPSGAYGIPQALPGDKMASAGADWQTSASTQITWGLNYIAGVYGTPCAAWGHSQATNWY